MKLHWLLPISTLVLACPADDGGNGNDSSSSESSGSESTASSTMTTTTMSTTATTMTTDMTDPTTTGMTDPDSSGTESSTTDPATSTESGSGSESGGSSSSGGPVASTYGPCDFTDPKNPTCPVDGEECNLNPNDVGPDTPFQHWCAIPCEGKPDECPEPDSGDAMVDCSMFFEHCALNCTDDLTCPDDMVCIFVGMGVSRCFWETEQP